MEFRSTVTEENSVRHSALTVIRHKLIRLLQTVSANEAPDSFLRKMGEKSPIPKKITSQEKVSGANISPNVEKGIDYYVDQVLEMGVEGIVKQYREIASYRAPDAIYKYTAFTANPTRNRYQDIVCLDKTRVVLKYDVPPSTDYIHANWVRFDRHDRTFIATQGPLDNTISDFWRMIFQEQCPSIVNLTKFVEQEKIKCSLYWPAEAGKFTTYGKIFVNTKKVESEDKFTIYTIELVPEGCSDSHIVKLIHMTTWPDQGVPQSGRHVLRLLRKVVADKQDCGPVVMHCSAGVGRTGCIIMIDVILRQLFAGKPVDTVDVFKKLRDQRANSIPVDVLYVFVYISVIDYIRAKLPGKYKEKTQRFMNDFKTFMTQRLNQ
nr:Protein-tyrosine phosphatase domain containing protein [Haemonchus contortus]